jgi:hypothetical protein
MEQIFFLVLVAIVGLARWIIQSAEKKKNAEAERQSSAPPPNLPPGHAPAQTEEERVRRFFEALGIPTSTTPPPPKQPRQVTPKKPRAKPTISPIDPFPVQRPRIAPPPPIASSVTTFPEPPPVPPPPPIAVPPVARLEPVLTAYDVRNLGDTWSTEPAPSAEALAPSASGMWPRFATADGLRDAIILREIFGPPRGLQTSDHALASSGD